MGHFYVKKLMIIVICCIKITISNLKVVGFIVLRSDLESICILFESKKVDEDVVMSWINRTLPNLADNFSPDCIYNADETGLFWKILPESTLDIKGNK